MHKGFNIKRLLDTLNATFDHEERSRTRKYSHHSFRNI